MCRNQYQIKNFYKINKYYLGSDELPSQESVSLSDSLVHKRLDINKCLVKLVTL